MEYKKLGNTNLKISRIGFGCWAIGGHGYGKVDDNESIRAIQKALDLGINFFDTADVYGFGHSEEVLTKALGEKAKDVVIATKFGVGWDKNGGTYKDCSPERARKALEDSLHRLKVNCIPLYQIHWYDNKTNISDTMEVLERCREEGKIMHIGCSNFSSDLLFEATKTSVIGSLQCEYSIIKNKIDANILNCSDKMKIGIIVFNVLTRGLLTGKYTSATKFDDNDTRMRDENFYGDVLKKKLYLINKLKQIGLHCGKSPAQIAIRWALENQNVVSAIVGAKTSEQVIENAQSLGWNFDQAKLALNELFAG